MTRTKESLIKALTEMIETTPMTEDKLATDFLNLQKMLEQEEGDTIEEERVFHLANEAALFEDEIEELLDEADTQI